MTEETGVEAPTAVFDPATAQLSVEAMPQGDAEVRFVVFTNLPTPIEVMAGVAFRASMT